MKAVVDALIQPGISFINTKGEKQKLSSRNIKIISPYNAQVNELQRALPEIQTGTVDKFQGQEASVIILSMASSSQEDAPKGNGIFV